MSIEDQIKEVFKKSWEIFSNQFATLILGTLLAILLMIFIVTIPPLIFGIYILCQNAIKEKARVSDIFEGFQYFFRSWGLILLLILGIICGLILLIIPGILLMIMWQYALAFAIIEKRGIIDSIGASYNFAKKNFGLSIIFWILIAVIGSIGGLTRIGILLTIPFTILTTVILVERFGRKKSNPRKNKK